MIHPSGSQWHVGSLERAPAAAGKQPARCLAGSSLRNGDPYMCKCWADRHKNPSPESGVNKDAWLYTREPFAWWGCSDLLVHGACLGGTSLGFHFRQPLIQGTVPVTTNSGKEMAEGELTDVS